MEVTATVHSVIETITLVIESVAILIIVAAILYGLVRYIGDLVRNDGSTDGYRAFKERLAGALLLGLEILVAADIIRTVALEPSIANVAALGLLVLIRTFLSWSLIVETDGYWPWKRRALEDEEKQRAGKEL